LKVIHHPVAQSSAATEWRPTFSGVRIRLTRLVLRRHRRRELPPLVEPRLGESAAVPGAEWGHPGQFEALIDDADSFEFWRRVGVGRHERGGKQAGSLLEQRPVPCIAVHAITGRDEQSASTGHVRLQGFRLRLRKLRHVREHNHLGAVELLRIEPVEWNDRRANPQRLVRRRRQRGDGEERVGPGAIKIRRAFDEQDGERFGHVHGSIAAVVPRQVVLVESDR
jgi:hypothetical protein